MAKNFRFLIKHLSSIHLMVTRTKDMFFRRYKMGLFVLSQSDGEIREQRKRENQGRGVMRTRVRRKGRNERTRTENKMNSSRQKERTAVMIIITMTTMDAIKSQRRRRMVQKARKKPIGRYGGRRMDLK